VTGGPPPLPSLPGAEANRGGEGVEGDFPHSGPARPLEIAGNIISDERNASRTTPRGAVPSEEGGMRNKTNNKIVISMPTRPRRGCTTFPPVPSGTGRQREHIGGTSGDK